MYIFLLAAFFGISISGGTKPRVPSRYDVVMPLAIGNSWIYKYEKFDEDRKREGRPELDTIKIIKSSRLDEDKIYFDSYDSERSYSAGFFNRKNGLWQYLNDDVISDDKKMIVPYPVRIDSAVVTGYPELDNGENNPNRGHEDTLMVTRVTLKEEDHSVTVPAGTFHCLKYLSEDVLRSDDSVTTYANLYYCIGKGLISKELYNRNSKGKWYLAERTKLLSFLIH
jgi:hypothetical protein